MSQIRNALTIIETMIMVTILAILAMIAIPKYAKSTDDARESALASDLRAARQQISLYMHQHEGRGPEVNEVGSVDTANFLDRMISRTTIEGALDANGKYGPYLLAWPSNPFMDPPADTQIKFGKAPGPPRDNTTGWYYSNRTSRLYANSYQGAEEYDP